MDKAEFERGKFPAYWQEAVEGPCAQGHRWVAAGPKLGFCPPCRRKGEDVKPYRGRAKAKSGRKS
jgi:hypothetical protein